MPFNVDRKQGGDNPTNTKFIEDCVSKITGTNKRTGKPYTKGEKIAICKTALKNKKSELELNPDEASVNYITSTLDSLSTKLINSGKATDRQTSYYLIDALLAKYNYDVDTLKLLV